MHHRPLLPIIALSTVAHSFVLYILHHDSLVNYGAH